MACNDFVKERLCLSTERDSERGGRPESTNWQHLGKVRKDAYLHPLSYPPAATKIISHALSSPQFGIILSLTSSYLREWVLRLACVVKGYICVARQNSPAYTRIRLLCQKL